MHPHTDSQAGSVPAVPAAGRALPNRLADWGAFAAAAGAALAAVSHADASIIYVDPTTKPDVKLPSTPPFNSDVTATDGFTIDNVPVALRLRHLAPGDILGGMSGGSKIGIWGSSFTARKFNPGSPIGGPGVNSRVYFAAVNTSGKRAGEFNTGSTGIAGFQLPGSKNGGNGWIRVHLTDLNGDGRFDELTVIDWAYNDAGGGITAGQTTDAVPEPSTKALALLALGSAGVLAWRKRRGQAVSARA
jgi:hypothetical protein